MLEVKNLSKKYNDSFVVKDVSFSVPKGNVLVLLGTSGCGKTTTLKMINKLVSKTTGMVQIQGRDADSVGPYTLRRNIGYVIQETGLFPHYTIEKNIGLVPDLLGWAKDKTAQRVDELLKLIGLDNAIKSRMPHELSGGQRQRVGLARALAADPDIILLDEPFGALDPISRKDMQKEFVQLEGALDKAMVLVTHDVTEAVALGDQICLMDAGEVQQLGSPQQLIFSPKNTFVKAFFEGKRLEIEPAIVSLGDLAIALTPTHERELQIVDHKLKLTEALAVQENDAPLGFVLNEKQYTVQDILQTYYRYRKDIAKKLSEDV